MIGKPIPRVEDQRFVTGNGQYTDDIQRRRTVACGVSALAPCARRAAFDRHRRRPRSARRDRGTGGPGLSRRRLQGVDHAPNPVDAIDATKKAFLTSLTGSIFNQPLLRCRSTGCAMWAKRSRW